MTQKYYPNRPMKLTPGEMVRTGRECREMTQAEFAKASGVSQPTLSAIEHDRIKLGIARAERIAKVLRIHPAMLLYPGLALP